MFFFEVYRAGLPLFAPSLRLLASWVRDHAILWERVYGSPQRVVSNDEPDNPNTNEGLEYWLNHSDQYVLPPLSVSPLCSRLLCTGTSSRT